MKSIDFSRNFSYGNDEIVHMMFSVDNLFHKMISEENWLDSALIHHNYVVLLGGAQESEEIFESFLAVHAQMLQRLVREKTDFTISIGISRPFCGLDGATRAYEEASDALKYKLITGDEAILNSEIVTNISSKKNSISTDLPEELWLAVRTINEQKAEELLTAYLDCCFQDNHSYIEFQAAISLLISGLLKIIYENNLTVSEILPEGDYLFEKIVEFRTRRELEEWFLKAIIKPLIERLAEQSDWKGRKISDEVIRIIQEHYDKDISLETCAQMLNYNANHVSRIFRKETGCSFTEYLQGYRLEKAKKLLCETDMKVQDIAELLCYGNSQNFIRYFRKFENMTPRQYREQNSHI